MTHPPTRSRTARLRPTVPALLAAVVLAGCSAAASTTGSSGATDDPVGPRTVTNCGVDVALDEAPERVVLLDPAPVTVLDGLGVLDRVVARAGVFDPAYYDDALLARIEAIPALTEEVDATGHLMISSEVVIAQQPDLVLGLPEGLTRDGMADAGAAVLVSPVFCPGGAGDASFQTLYDQVRDLGTVFGRDDAAAELVESLQDRVGAVEQVAPDDGRTAAVLYPSVGGGPLYAYGRGSMAQPQLDAAGLENVFADTADRVFEVGVEELVARDPDVLVVLYQGDVEGIVEEVTALPGAAAITAVRDDEILVQPFNFTEPSSPLTVTGLEAVVERFGRDGS
ncbi:ABC transporter substrate-binding protein [Isoptericola halotolerans]|uniref:Iron complex transport system substrate-binding protein n=1 Tax=Isoptericola halotolerans TaxID=300560 RepID=A0ABX2A303_9MICO|nr:iron complex transport system substrate-binding protein [Isoptericola halotolerans]